MALFIGGRASKRGRIRRLGGGGPLRHHADNVPSRDARYARVPTQPTTEAVNRCQTVKS